MTEINETDWGVPTTTPEEPSRVESVEPVALPVDAPTQETPPQAEEQPTEEQQAEAPAEEPTSAPEPAPDPLAHLRDERGLIRGKYRTVEDVIAAQEELERVLSARGGLRAEEPQVMAREDITLDDLVEMVTEKSPSELAFDAKAEKFARTVLHRDDNWVDNATVEDWGWVQRQAEMRASQQMQAIQQEEAVVQQREKGFDTFKSEYVAANPSHAEEPYIMAEVARRLEAEGKLPPPETALDPTVRKQMVDTLAAAVEARRKELGLKLLGGMSGIAALLGQQGGTVAAEARRSAAPPVASAWGGGGQSRGRDDATAW